MFLGNRNKTDTSDLAYFVYIHEKGAFWLNRGVPNLNYIKLKVGEQKVALFRKTYHSDLPTKSSCSEEEAFRITKCLKTYIEKTVGCSFNLFAITDSFETYNTSKKIKETLLLLKWLQDEEYREIARKTGCYNRCKYNSYEIEITNQRSIDWETAWHSEIYIYADSDIVEEREEYYTFDFTNLMGTIGGYLGKAAYHEKP